MGETAINGKIWNEAGLDLVVGDYFGVLGEAMAGRVCDLASHQRVLRQVTNRSGGAIAFLQGEISAVLTLIGLPTLKDHPPRWDFGDALADAVDRHLTAQPALLEDLAQRRPCWAASPLPSWPRARRPPPCRRRPVPEPRRSSPASIPPPATWTPAS